MIKQTFLGVGAAMFLLATLWWVFWAIAHLSGWAAVPLAVTGVVILLAGYAVCMAASLRDAGRGRGL